MVERIQAKRELFCREFLIDMNGAAAARRAGYSAASARQTAHELLTKPDIQASISELTAQRNARLRIDADQVLRELAKIAFANLGDFLEIDKDGAPSVDLRNVAKGDFGVLANLTYEIHEKETIGGTRSIVRRIGLRLQPKVAALVKLGEHVGLFRGGPNKHGDPLTDLILEINREGSVAPIRSDRLGKKV
ncbi:terminase small subunit [Frigidibacter sp. ROC022]|uniref:terminase small subunit n=1 Tax=Frigidibacter sp. ROC022 TaxID=2971796 RepID=UPI00215AD88E|nr:terminase small subunit [Frigidibacter sp. ROC022]MCR8726730.1 terminase small subunit [Frigidibacter sp. ROC022]